MIHLRDHAARFLVVGGTLLKILTDAIFELFGLTDVDDLAAFIHHQINARCERQVVCLVEQLLLGHRPLPPLVYIYNS